ncbi:MAG: hypothetical protein QNJ74_22060 [Trichodesmium sp. MO_231.B1]|nr:hypothetical protein [Trichodesmium sp. MO_231.B1]
MIFIKVSTATNIRIISQSGNYQVFLVGLEPIVRENIAKKQFGNAVSIQVVYYLAKSLVRLLGFLY